MPTHPASERPVRQLGFQEPAAEKGPVLQVLLMRRHASVEGPRHKGPYRVLRGSVGGPEEIQTRGLLEGSRWSGSKHGTSLPTRFGVRTRS